MAQQEWKFLVGAALSVYQNSGGRNTNWSDFEGKKNSFGKPTIHNDERCGDANRFWDHFEEDIQRAKALNSNCLRLSIEWGRIEPQRGTYDAAAIQRYHAMFDSIQRSVCLAHEPCIPCCQQDAQSWASHRRSVAHRCQLTMSSSVVFCPKQHMLLEGPASTVHESRPKCVQLSKRAAATL